MRILHVITTLDPSHGGPPEGLRQLAQAVTRFGASISVATLDAPHSEWLKRFPAQVHALGPAYSHYHYAPRYREWLARHHHEFDAVVVNGLWQYHGYATRAVMRRAGRSYFVFTHGMLDPWFRRRYPLKHLKKWLYWPWGEYRVLRDAAAVLFTCEEESRLAPQSFWLYRARARTVGYGIAEPEGRPDWQVRAFRRRYRAVNGRRLLLYLARLHEKKGCDLLIDAFAEAARTDEALLLMMAGPGEPAYVERLQSQARRRGVESRILWPGMLRDDLKWGALRAAEAFALTSHQENFGIAVVEALACGTPVIISDQVNIWREIEQDGAGIVCRDDREGAARALRGWAALPAAERDGYAGRARECFRARFHIEGAARRLVEALKPASAGAAV